MIKLKKVAAVVVMVGGMALGGGVAHAGNGHGYDDPSNVIIPNLQTVKCKQDFHAGTEYSPVQVGTSGDNNQAIGNFCTVVGPVDKG